MPGLADRPAVVLPPAGMIPAASAVIALIVWAVEADHGTVTVTDFDVRPYWFVA